MKQKRLKLTLLVTSYVFLSAFSIVIYFHGTARETVIRRFSQISYDDPQTWKRNHWLGIRTLQNPNDVWITQEIISEVKPDVIVETGTFSGGSAILWATILREINPEGRVLTIDVEDQTAPARKVPIFLERVDFLLGSSVDPKIVAEVHTRVNGKRVLVILDSDHKKDHVLKEMESYAPVVPVNSYLIVQDSNINGHPVRPSFGPGPMEAIQAFLSSRDDFLPDRERERLLFTMHPSGYLKRIK